MHCPVEVYPCNAVTWSHTSVAFMSCTSCSCLAQLDLRTFIGTIEYTETEEEEKNVKVLDLVKTGEIAFSALLPSH